METLQTVSYLFDNCHMPQEDVLSIVVISGEMFNKNACLFSKTNEGLKMGPTHNTHTQCFTAPHPPDLLLCTLVPSTTLSSFMKFFSQALIWCNSQVCGGFFNYSEFACFTICFTTTMFVAWKYNIHFYFFQTFTSSSLHSAWCSLVASPYIPFSQTGFTFN